MEPWAREMLDIWEAKLSEISAASMREIDRLWVAKYSAGDLEQMIRGARAMMTEELEGRKTDLREDYFDTVIPALASAGERISTMCAADLAMAIRIALTVLPAVSPEHRVQASEFFVEWQARLMEQLVTSSIAAGAQP